MIPDGPPLGVRCGRGGRHGSRSVRAHRRGRHGQASEEAGLRRVRQDRRRLGAPADVPAVRGDATAATRRPTGTPPSMRAPAGHPVVASAQPGERWLYCYVDDALTEY